MSEQINRSPLVPAWKIWANPIIRRYARSRMRPTTMGITLLIVILIAGFIFFASRATGFSRVDWPVQDIARTAIPFLLFFQGALIFFLGSGQVAGGMTAETDEGVLDYQRLAPMTPLSKVVGYLIGLPIREWALFLAVTPFTLFSMIQGEVPFSVIIQIHAVFITTALVYHITSLVAGTVMKNKRWAFLGSMLLVVILNLVLPQASKLGLVYFKYLTIYPVIEESARHLTPRYLSEGIETIQNFIPSARFFNLDLPQAAFTIISQAVLIFFLGMMLWRRWRKNENHLLGKIGATGFFAWVQLVFLGNALPMMNSGEIFPSYGLSQRFRNFTDGWQADLEEALMMVGAFGFVTVIMLWFMIFLITPSHEGLVRGWRRARKQGRSRLTIVSDPATATPWVAFMAGIGTISWMIFSRSLLNSRHFPEYELSASAFLAFAITLLTAGFIFQTILEWKGKRFAGLAALFGGVLPLMVGTVAIIISDDFLTLAIWLFGICPASWPAYGTVVAFPADILPIEIARVIPNAFWFWQGVAILAVGKMLWELMKFRVNTSKSTK